VLIRTKTSKMTHPHTILGVGSFFLFKQMVLATVPLANIGSFKIRKELGMQHVLNRVPFDSHVHLRRGLMTSAIAPYTARQCWGGVIMPNTATPHILTPKDADDYLGEINAATSSRLAPVMTGYLTTNSDPAEIRAGFEDGSWAAMKVYPRAAGGHGTTNSADGIDMWNLVDHPALPVMQEIGMPLLIHPEVNTEKDGVTIIDIYDRERRAIPILRALRKRYPELKISAEHGTSIELARFMEEHGDPEFMVCTVTPQHLLFDRRDLHENGFQPHLFCYPILKRTQSRNAWRKLATSGAPFVSAGTDSAPHPTHAKEQACGCAGGVFTAHAMVPLYTEVFASESSLGNLEDFLCVNGPRFFGLESHPGKVVLERKSWTSDSLIEVEDGVQVHPFGYHEDPEKRYQFAFRISSSSWE